MINGIVLALAACFIWGLIFIIPHVLAEFSPIEIALGRYLFFGLISCLFMLLGNFKKWRQIPRQFWFKAFRYALIVNILYYFSLVLGIRYATAPVIALILGISPISIAFYGNWRQKECSFRQLIFPSLLIAIGICLINYHTLSLESHYNSIGQYLFGLFCGTIALVTWNWYVVANAAFLRHNSHLPASDWSTLIGIGTLFWVILIGGILACITPVEKIQKYLVLDAELKRFIWGSLTLGLICSWLGSYLWNSATKFLPVSFAGQLTIFETVFGLIFIYFIEHRYPSPLELSGIIVILSGVAISTVQFKAPHALSITEESLPVSQ